MKFPLLVILSGIFLLSACGGSGPTSQADTIAPSVALSAVQNGTSVVLSAAASDNVGVSKVEFYRGNQLITTDAATPYTASDTVTAAGSATYTAKAYDAAGNIGQSSKAITLTFTQKNTLYQGVWGWAIGSGSTVLDAGATIFADEIAGDNGTLAVGAYLNEAQNRSGIVLMGPITAPGNLEIGFTVGTGTPAQIYFTGSDTDNVLGLYQGKLAFGGTGALFDANNKPTRVVVVALVQSSTTVPSSLTAQAALKTQAKALALDALRTVKLNTSAQSVKISPALLESVEKASSLLR